MEPASFLNLDLELRSRYELAPLARYLEDHASLLYAGKFGEDYQITAEPLIGGHSNQSAEACTGELLTTIVSLPKDLRDLFEGAHVRLFDYGFNGGLDERPCAVDIPATQLLGMAELGIGLRVSVYPHKGDSTAREGSDVNV